VATILRFEDIVAWQVARKLTREIYRISNEGQLAKDYGLRDQVRRAAVSVMANIAEGFERDGAREFLQFLAIAKGSVGEVRSHLYVALDQGYVHDEHEWNHVMRLANETARMIHGLMRYLRQTGVKGLRFKPEPETRNPKLET
jgi:four helix bundle protein